MTYLNKYDIQGFIGRNKERRQAVEAFKAEYPRRTICDIYEMAHFVLPMTEICIEFIEGNTLQRFTWIEEDEEVTTKTITLRCL